MYQAARCAILKRTKQCDARWKLSGVRLAYDVDIIVMFYLFTLRKNSRSAYYGEKHCNELGLISPLGQPIVTMNRTVCYYFYSLPSVTYIFRFRSHRFNSHLLITILYFLSVFSFLERLLTWKQSRLIPS